MSNITGRPNILFILADDMGWGDLGCYGHDRIKTPNLDRMASEGRLFTNYYCASSVCSPSRAGLLTGQFPGSNGIHDYLTGEHEVNAKKGCRDFLDPEVLTIPRMFRAAGYRTGHFGKWHLGHTDDSPSPFAYGYDEQKTTASSDHNWDDYAGNPALRPHSTRMIADETISFIESCRRDGKPFFVNCWLQDPHAVLNPPEELMTEYRKFTTPEVSFPSAPTIYYSVISDIDRHVGRMLEALDALGLAKETLVMFSSDNGPEEMEITNAAHSAAGSPGPFRGRKRSLYDGGIRMPFLARLPGRIPAGTIDDANVIGAVDMMPTFCDIADIGISETQRLDGEVITDALIGKRRERSKAMVWEFACHPMYGHVINKSPTLAIRRDRYKLLMNPERDRVELYDIPEDRSELGNVAGKYPEVVTELSSTLIAWKESCPKLVRDFRAGSNAYRWPGT
jgi:arylsulfatase A-like enzyme